MHLHLRRRAVTLAVATALGGGALVALPFQVAGASVSAASPITYQSSTVPLMNLGTVNLSAIAASESGPPTGGSVNGKILDSGDESPVGPGTGNGATLFHGSIGGSSSSVSTNRNGQGGLVGFEGISGPAQAAVNGGGDLEPPDQGLCVGPDGRSGPIVMEFINNAVAGYSPSGTQELATIPSYALFNQPSSDFLSDPRCMYDPDTGRWFFQEFVVGNVGPNNTEESPSIEFEAVSQTSNPLGNYTVFGIDTTDTANTAGGCPCFGDFDQLGADSNGIYIATNEFSTNEPYFNGAVIYAISKWRLAAAADGAPLPTVARYAVTEDAFGQPYHISPATAPVDASNAPNTEYFVESNSDANSDNHLLVYALSDTRALNFDGVPTLSATEVTSEGYAFPPNAVQKLGPTPLGTSVGDPEGTIQTDFNAVQEVTYTDGSLYGEMSTAIGNTNNPRAGIAWFKLGVSNSPSGLSAGVENQGYVQSSVDLMYPDVVVDGSGNGYLAFSLSGTTSYPSTADMSFGSRFGPTGPINVTGAGTAPEDGFTCYAAFVGPDYGGCRWGDYSGGQYFDGRVYMGGEYIPPTAPDAYTNWGTFLWSRPQS